MFDADGNQMVDKREFLVVSVKAQNRNIDLFSFLTNTHTILTSQKVRFLIKMALVLNTIWWIMKNSENALFVVLSQCRSFPAPLS